MSDRDQQLVYTAEHRVEAAMGHTVRIAGQTIDVEPAHVFTTLAAASLDATLTCIELGLPPVTVCHRNGDAKAHYQRGEIHLPSWGGTKHVLSHELAHHVVAYRHPGAESHGPQFRTALLDLLPPGQAQYLRMAITSAGLSVPIACH